MHEAHREQTESFGAPRLKLLLQATIFAGLACGIAAVAVTPAGRHWLAEQAPAIEYFRAWPLGNVLVVFLLLGAASLSTVVAFHTARRAVTRRPALVIDASGLWHDTLPGGPHEYRWEEVSQVLVRRRDRRGHTTHHVVLVLEDAGSSALQRRAAAAINVADVAASRERILDAIRRYAPNLFVDPEPRR